MGEAADCTLFLKLTTNKLSSWIPQVLSSSAADAPPSAEQELQMLGSTLRMIHDKLDKAEEKDVSDKSDLLRLKELKEAAYDVDDVMDEYEYDVLHAKSKASQRQTRYNFNFFGKLEEVFDWNSYQPKIYISNEFVDNIKQMREKFEEITGFWEKIRLDERDGETRPVKKWTPPETSSFFNKVRTFGRKDDKKKVTDWLLQDNETQKDRVCVLAIVGMGGLGKTTLTHMAYNEQTVQRRFDVTGWVCVSDDFDVSRLIEKISRSFKLAIDKNMSLDELIDKMKEHLKEKKFLLVLDDVWNENIKLWDSLKTTLFDNGTGKIIVTTRNETVAEIMQTTEPIRLGYLPFADCWSLFEEIAFEGRDQNSRNNLFPPAKEIVRKCDGIPLAVKVLASLLRVEDDETWIEILKSGILEQDKSQDGILPPLKLSFDRMPIELRSCFMYLSLFPKDSRLHKPTIVRQWMSHGFLQSSGSGMLEDIGNDYFNELVQRSLLQHYDSSNDIFIMHDLIHDLAKHVARDEYLLMTSEELHDEIPQTVRHVSFYYAKEDSIIARLKPLFQKKRQVKRIRTLILHEVDAPALLKLFHNSTCLRTLVFCTERSMDLSGWISELKHLRYLDIPDVPRSVYNLYHLQTLNSNLKSSSKFWHSRSRVKLPRAIGNLINLRHIHGYDMNTLPPEIGRLTHLQKLEYFPVGSDGGRCKVKHLKDLASLKGDLKVIGLETVKWSDFNPQDDYMMNKTGIEDVRLRWNGNANRQDGKMAEQVLNCLRPHHDLRFLHISGYPEAAFSKWLGDASFTGLHELDLYNCSCTSLPTLGHLPSLAGLKIGGMKRLKNVGREFLSSLDHAAALTDPTTSSSHCCFQSLEELNFYRMDELEEWQGVEDIDFPRLRLLIFRSSPKLRRFPSLSSLRHLRIYNCAKLRRFPLLPSVLKLDLVGEWNTEVLYGCSLPVLRTLKIYLYPGASLVLPDQGHLHNLHSLEELVIGECRALSSVEGFGVLTSLQRLVFKLCPKLTTPANERVPPSVQNVHIIDNESPENIEWYRSQLSKCTDRQLKLLPQLKLYLVIFGLNWRHDGDHGQVMKVLWDIEGIKAISVDANNNEMTVIGTMDPVAITFRLRKKASISANILSVNMIGVDIYN